MHGFADDSFGLNPSSPSHIYIRSSVRRYITSNAHEHGGSGGGPSIVINPANKNAVLRLRPNVDYVVTLGYNTDVFSGTGQLMGGLTADKGGSSSGKASPMGVPEAHRGPPAARCAAWFAPAFCFCAASGHGPLAIFVLQPVLPALPRSCIVKY